MKNLLVQKDYLYLVKFSCLLDDLLHKCMCKVWSNGENEADTLPGPEGGGGDGEVLGLPHGAGQVVREVMTGLHGLGELDHHHGGQGGPVLRLESAMG